MKHRGTAEKDLANGIHILRYCRRHETAVRERLAAGDDPAQLLAWHVRKTAWMQHERLIHLLVTMLTAGAFFFAFGIFLWLARTGAETAAVVCALFLAAVLLILLACYLLHYFRLENTVQHWYRIAEELQEKIRENGENARTPGGGTPEGGARGKENA